MRAEAQQQPRAGPTELLKPELYVSAPQGLYPAPLTPAQTASGAPGAKVGQVTLLEQSPPPFRLPAMRVRGTLPTAADLCAQSPAVQGTH